MAVGAQGSVAGCSQAVEPNGLTGSQLALRVAQAEQCSLWTGRQVRPKESEEVQRVELIKKLVFSFTQTFITLYRILGIQ